MADNSAASIKTAINSKLGEVTELKEVHIGRTADFSSGFPACRFYLSGIENDLLDNQPTYFRTYQFAIEIIQVMKGGDEATDEGNFEAAVDAVLDKLGTEWRLGNNVDVSVVQASPVTYAEEQQGQVVSCIITLQAKTFIS